MRKPIATTSVRCGYTGVGHHVVPLCHKQKCSICITGQCKRIRESGHRNRPITRIVDGWGDRDGGGLPCKKLRMGEECEVERVLVRSGLLPSKRGVKPYHVPQHSSN